jgi:anti-sigma factor RsiW
VNCQHARMLIHGYVDGELDLVRALEIEHHTRGCGDCMREYKAQLALREAIGASSLYDRAPADLQRRVRSSVRQANRAASPQRALPWRRLGLAAALLALVIVAAALARTLLMPSVNDRLADEVLASHVRSLMADHLTDVASSDQHTVKPWFDGKLDFSPAVEDLASQGFPLIGGRLDYLDNHPVAALVYQRRRHFINLFIWPSSDMNAAARDSIYQGYNLIHWSQSGMTYWAASDLSPDELRTFVQLVQQRAAPTESR